MSVIRKYIRNAAVLLLAFAALASASFGAAIPKIRANSVSVSGSPDVTVTYELEGDSAIVTAEAFIGGAAFCLACDLIARTVFSPTELSISSVTAVFGAPIVISIMIRRRREH